MTGARSIMIVGAGAAGWLTAAYLARFFALAGQGDIAITLLESPDLGIIGVGEGTFPTIRGTLDFLGIDETTFLRATSATFKQGIRFDDWLHAPAPDGRRHHYVHPFEAPLQADDADLLAAWLGQDAATRLPFAQATSIQHGVALHGRAPKRPEEGGYAAPLSYAYHFDATKFAALLRDRAVELGVRHLTDHLTGVERSEDGTIARILTRDRGPLGADLYVDCTGFRAELIGRALGAPFRSVRHHLFTDRALACKIPYDRPDAPIQSVTIAAAHEAGWTWDIGLEGARGIGCVYSSAHMDDEQAAGILRAHIGHDRFQPRLIPFDPGYREAQWIGNSVAVGLSGGFLEPLESTGILLIEAAVAMIAELFPLAGPIDAPAARFNQLIVGRYERIVDFLKLHYCLSRRDEPFWRDNADPASMPESLRAHLEQWRYRPPGRFDFTLDLESFAPFNYHYILYGMDYPTLPPPRPARASPRAADRLFARVRSYSDQATRDLPTNRAFLEEIGA